MDTDVSSVRSRPRRRVRLAGAAALVVALVAPVAACAGTNEPAEPGVTTPATVTSAPASPSPSGQGGGTAPRSRSAADQLADFFSAATRMDADLRDAAKRINGGVRRDVIVLEPATVAAVRAIQPSRLLGTIPGGMDRELLRSAMLLYSVLVSRRDAMDRVVEFAPSAPLPRAGSDAQDLVTCLGNGGPAARRFAGDLAAMRTLASSSKPIAVAKRDSRATAEVAVRAAYIDVLNGGCDSCGGGVLTRLLPVVWKGQGRLDGTVGGVQFEAAFTAGSGWKVSLNAC
ncbi:hypothetical protein [Phytohabitans suffuscus]|uniref:Lipoprotein n=1 Tax=Phytohabitans suffuscus TaxID=624315 RepID=A0A6F8YTP0_9ACTN|nr:hypothetical protein [Phytohabitans suffuscus]BCB89545.1 hypothetical protein Psuf_068580 [Phytohabitans suffuscus]